MKRTTVEMGSFGPQVASARAASAAVSAWAKPDQARGLSVLQSFGPAAGPHLAGGLAKHFEQRNVAGRRLAERDDHNGDKVAAARDRCSAAEEANASRLRQPGASAVSAAVAPDKQPAPPACTIRPPSNGVRKGPVLGGHQSYEFGAYDKCQADFVASKAREGGADQLHPQFGHAYQKSDGWYVLAPWSAW